MKCAIQWIDCNGNATPDENEAIGFAVIDPRACGHGVMRFPICAVHLASMGQVHHGRCFHVSSDPARWTFEPLEGGEQA